jgi:hypothetical protein
MNLKKRSGQRVDNKQARQFVDDYLLSLWDSWAEKVTPQERMYWANTLKPYTWEACKAGLEKYFNSADYTFRKPKSHALIKYINKSAKGSKGGGHVSVWIQNTITGVFYELFFSANTNADMVLASWFKKHHNSGEWKVYRKGDISHCELLKYQANVGT